MQIGQNRINKNSREIQTKQIDSQNIGDIKRNAMRNLYKKACLDVPNEENFKPVVEKFYNPKNGEIYSLAIQNACNKKNPYEKTLNLGFTTDEEKYLASIPIARGSKQDILDYLGNEKNLETINYYINYLRKKSQDY